MGMTIWRWSAIVAAICVGIAAILLPFGANRAPSWMVTPPASLAAEMRKLTQASAAAHGAVRSYRTAQALDRWNAARAATDTTAIRMDVSVPSRAASTARAIVAEQWDALGLRASSAHAEVFVYLDSTSIPRANNVGDKPRALEGRALADVVFALPDATDGERCVALVRLRGSSPAHIAALRNQSVLGVCGFFAAFGMPGDGVRPWLAATSYRFARRSDWFVARAPSLDVTSQYGLSDAGGRCLMAKVNGCLDALRINDPTHGSGRMPAGRPRLVIDPTAPSSSGVAGVRNAALGAAEDQLLADAVRSVGADRFAQFWRSSSRPDAAFLSATGTTLDSWTQQWLTRTYGAVGEHPIVRPRNVAWLAIALPVLLIAAVRPRAHVIAAAR